MINSIPGACGILFVFRAVGREKAAAACVTRRENSLRNGVIASDTEGNKWELGKIQHGGISSG